MRKINILLKIGISLFILFNYFFIFCMFIWPVYSVFFESLIISRIMSFSLLIVRVILIVYFYNRVGKFKKIDPKSKHYWQGTIIIITFIVLPWYIWKADDKLVEQELNIQD